MAWKPGYLNASPCPCSSGGNVPVPEPPVPPPPPPEPPLEDSDPGQERTVETATAGGITVELSYMKRRRRIDGFRQTVYRNMRVEISHGGLSVYDQSVPAQCGRRCAPAPPRENGKAIRLADLDGDKDLEALAELTTSRAAGGVACCHLAAAYALDGPSGTYTRTVVDTGEDHRLRSARGAFLIQGADRRYLNVLACPECGSRPIRIWRYDEFEFHDVTTQHPDLIQAQLRGLRRGYRRARKGALAVYRKGFLTPLVADLCLLNQCDRGLSMVRLAIRRGEIERWGPPDRGVYGNAYLRTLKRFLGRTGYTR